MLRLWVEIDAIQSHPCLPFAKASAILVVECNILSVHPVEIPPRLNSISPGYSLFPVKLARYLLVGSSVTIIVTKSRDLSGLVARTMRDAMTAWGSELLSCLGYFSELR